MSLRQRFINTAKSDFAFLSDVYGFSLILPASDSSLESIRYDNFPLYIEIGWYKGEIDVIVGYSGETAILRPYKSRIFNLSEIALHSDSQALQDAPRFPNYITAEKDMIAALACWANILKKYGPPILRGDIRLLEEISLNRV